MARRTPTLANEVDAFIDSLGDLTPLRRALAATARRLAALLVDPDERAKAGVAKELRAVLAELAEGVDDVADDPASIVLARLRSPVEHAKN